MSAQDPGPPPENRMRLASLIALLCLAGCASAPAQVSLPATTPDTLAQARLAPQGPRRQIELNQSFEAFRAETQRLADIAFRLASANADLCPDRAPLSGLTLHTAAEYSKNYAATLDIFAMPRPAVLAVAAASPAAAAGLRADDLLLAIDGKPFAAISSEEHQTTRPTEAANALLKSNLTVGRPSRLRIERDGRDLELSLVADSGCDYRVDLAVGSTLQPLASWLLLPPASSRGLPASPGQGGNVVISERMVSYARDDSELAFAIGHEYAHNLLHHPAGVGPAGEAEADYVGLYLMARAGYDTAKVIPFWIQLSRDYPEEPLAHSGATTRIARLIATRQEIEAKRAAGQPLIPNLIGR